MKMKQFLVITFWEFYRHFRSRSFLLSTFFSPLLFGLIILIPTLYLNGSDADNPHAIGCVELDTTHIAQKIVRQFRGSMSANEQNNNIQLSIIEPDTSAFLKRRFTSQARLQLELDSLEDAYNKIKERRKYIFQRAKTRGRDELLKQTYEQLIRIRESRDLMELEYQKHKIRNDSLWRTDIIRKADDLLRSQQLEGYVLINPDEFFRGVVEFHSFLPAGFLQFEPIRQAIQVVIVEERIRQEGVQVDKIQEWLAPIEFREIQLQGEEKQEFDFLITYLGPIIVVLFLFISIFTSSGFLFNGVIKEKNSRVVEILLSSVSHGQLIAGKIFGLGMLGIFQILIWFVLTALLILLNILKVGEVGFLNLQNAALFLLYFTLGYLFFSSVYVGVGSIFSTEEDAQHLNQFLRILSIFPIVLAVLVLESPNALPVRILSFIPPLTPTFMILRTPLGNPPVADYYISTAIMLLAIILSVFVAGKMFKIGSLLHGKKPTLKEAFSLIFSK